MPGSRYDAAYDQVRRFVISQPVSERDIVGSHKSEHLNAFPPLSCPSATKSLRRSLLRTRPCMSTAHCCYFRLKVWLRTPCRRQQLPASSLLFLLLVLLCEMSGLADVYVDEQKVAMCQFLSTVDAYTERKVNDPVVVETCETLSRNGLKLPGDLVNIVPRDVTHIKDAMQRGFISRAISKSEANFMRSAVPARADRSEGLNIL